MNRTSGNLLLEGKAEIRSIGQPCDASCAMWFCCQNSTRNGTCKGFVLLNGKSKDILRKNMCEDDLIYLENSARIIQNGCSLETRKALTNEVYRYLKPINDILREEPAFGFRAMLDRAITPTPEESTSKPITRSFRDGFLGMLEDASRSSEPESVTIRNFGTVHHPEYGFKAMLESAFGETPTITKPIHRTPLGYRGMLDVVSRGTEEAQPITRSFQDQPQQYGMLAMARAAFGYENPTNKREPILRDLQRQLRAILNAR